MAIPTAAGTWSEDPNTGKLTLLKEPTKDHPAGNCARAADGTPIVHAPAAPKDSGAKAAPIAPAPAAAPAKKE